jgi:uncharacterized protein with HEPN domain
MDKKTKVLISKTIEYIEKIIDYVKNVDKQGFASNMQVVEACVFCLLQIGELTKRFNDDFQKNHTEIPWHKIRGLRNRLVHEYDGVDVNMVWLVIKDDLPKLHNQLTNIKE